MKYKSSDPNFFKVNNKGPFMGYLYIILPCLVICYYHIVTKKELEYVLFLELMKFMYISIVLSDKNLGYLSQFITCVVMLWDLHPQFHKLK